MANDSSKYTITTPQSTYDNGNTSYSYTISTTYTPQIITFQSQPNNGNKPPNKRAKSSTPTLSSKGYHKGYQLQSPSRPKPIAKHAKSTSNILTSKKNKSKPTYASSFNDIPENNKLNNNNNNNNNKNYHSNHQHDNQELKSPGSPHQRSVSNLTMKYDPDAGSYGYSMTTTYHSTIPTYVSEHSIESSSAFGTSHSPSVSYIHVAPIPMYHTASVAYLTAPTQNKNNTSKQPKTNNKNTTNTNTNTNKNKNKNKRKKIKPRHKSPQSRSLPPTPTHPKSRSFTHRNDIILPSANKLNKNKGFTVKSPTNNNNNNNNNSVKQKLSTISNSSNSNTNNNRTLSKSSNSRSSHVSKSRSHDSHLSDELDELDELDEDDMDQQNDTNTYADPQQIMRSRTLNDSDKIKYSNNEYAMNSNPLCDRRDKNSKKNIQYRDNKNIKNIKMKNITKSKSQNNSRAGSLSSSADSFGHDNDQDHEAPRSSNFKQHGHHTRHSNTFSAAKSKAPVIKQSKSLNDGKHEAKTEEKKQTEQKQENADWQIMGDILFSLRHSLICRMYGLDNEKNEKNEKKKKSKKNKKNKKKHLQSKQNEWQTFFFEEYAQELFAELRAKWLDCDSLLSDTYVKKLFGETSSKDACIPVEELDINKSCKYYWRRLNTNSKSGQIFFQTVNGEYIIKSMPKSEAQFFVKSFLDKYYSYMLSAPDSLLMRIMGCYNIKYKKMNMNLASNNEYNSKRKQDVNKGVYVIVMKSILFCEMTPTVKMHKIYDLKGSTHNRTASRYKLELDKLTFDVLSEIDQQSFEQEINSLQNISDNIKLISHSYSTGFYQPKKTENQSKFKQDQKNKPNPNVDQCITVYKRSKVLKDLDFITDNEGINVGEKMKSKYLSQLRKDLDFLISMNVMDYSLLVGIHRLDAKKKAKHRRQHSHNKPKRIKAGNLFTFEFGGMCAEKIMFANPSKKSNKKNIYFTGIIDFLQKYNTKKKVESYYKRVKVSEGKDAISSVDSKTYANRLYDFIQKRTV